eukprot:NODE_1992_length_791_cov_15.525606_g1583_i0.p1 GENE.NODE_1992_length_791_cov_15.525606_g1583_i0~~NODE_1992_length_791_cov_15.525606_g1583_i0.p1  ORF type:complete len:174 (-),score=35.86 NODE_1992_length_791_cov_15.525606_g1583_i0:270-746(-)
MYGGSNPSTSKLHVTLVGARDLVKASQPRVGFRIWNDGSPSNDAWVYSSVKSGNSPVWNQPFQFDVLPDSSVEVSVKDAADAKTSLGENFIYVAEMEANQKLPFNMVLLGGPSAPGTESRVELELFLHAAASEPSRSGMWHCSPIPSPLPAPTLTFQP